MLPHWCSGPGLLARLGWIMWISSGEDLCPKALKRGPHQR